MSIPNRSVTQLGDCKINSKKNFRQNQSGIQWNTILLLPEPIFDFYSLKSLVNVVGTRKTYYIIINLQNKMTLYPLGWRQCARKCRCYYGLECRTNVVQLMAGRQPRLELFDHVLRNDCYCRIMRSTKAPIPE